MNEQILELAKQAGVSGQSETTLHPNQVKFAELIVKECVQTLRDNTPVVDDHDSVEDWDRGYIRAMVDCEHHIQEHFGVTEKPCRDEEWYWAIK